MRVLASIAFALGCGAGGEARPNVVLIVVDTLRADHLSGAGYGRDTSPRLTQLAAEGVRFSRAYAASASTAPTHASLFTGKRPPGHGLVKNGLPLDASHATLAEVLRGAGYQTAAFVSSFVLNHGFGFDQGFESYDDDFEFETSSVKTGEWEGNPVENEAFDRTANATNDRALAWLRDQRDGRRPFFLFLHYFDPHAPFLPPGEHAWKFFENPGVVESTGDPELDNAIRRYDGEIAFTDREIGRFLDALAEMGLAQNTLLVMTADHGEGLRQHGHMTHGVDVYDEAVRVPFLVRWPGRLPAGLVLASPIGTTSLAPTLLDLLGVPFPDGRYAERSLAGVLRGESAPAPEEPVYLFRRHYQRRQVEGIAVEGVKYAVVEGKWKYIEPSAEGFARELYDLDTDPGERSNRFEAEPQVAAPLARRIAQWRAEAGDAVPVPRIADDERDGLEALGYLE